MKGPLREFIQHDLLGFRGPARLEDDDDLLDSGVDSVGMMALVLHIEEQWDLVVPPEDVVLENFQSIRAIEAYLQARLHGE
jgi:D-alanine--poly(phosphoribitol) ligase subunit 2